MTSPDLIEVSEVEHEFPEAFIRNLATYGEIRDPNIHKQLLLSRVRNNPNVDVEFLEKAYALAEVGHKGQVRKDDIPPSGESKKPYTTHTNTAALLVADYYGEDVTTLQLAGAILHDIREDGKLYKGTAFERPVMTEDIVERLGGGELAQQVAWSVDNLSRKKYVRDQKGGFVKIKISDDLYDEQLARAEIERPEAGIFVIKYGADRPNNMFDPPVGLVKPVELVEMPAKGEKVVFKEKKKKDAWSRREAMVTHARTVILPKLADYPRLYARVAATANLAEHSLQRGFTIQRHMSRQMAA